MKIPASLARAVHGNRPLGRLLRPIVTKLLPSTPTTISVLSGVGRGIRLVIEPQRERFYWTGAHEPSIQRELARRLRPGSVFWDVGAHIGYFSLMASRLVGNEGQVLAFEPLPANAARLRRAIALNAARNITLLQVAIADAVRLAPFYESGSTLTGGLLPQGTSIQTVACTTLDAMALVHRPPDLIKIDVERAELRVLGGARKLLETHPVLIIELDSDANRAAAETLLSGWRFESIGRPNWLVHR